MSKQVSRQGVVIHRVILAWGPSPCCTGEACLREAHTPCWEEPGVKPCTSLEFPASHRVLRLTPRTQQHHRPLGRRVLPNVRETEITWFLITLSPSISWIICLSWLLVGIILSGAQGPGCGPGSTSYLWCDPGSHFRFRTFSLCLSSLRLRAGRM